MKRIFLAMMILITSACISAREPGNAVFFQSAAPVATAGVAVEDATLGARRAVFRYQHQRKCANSQRRNPDRTDQHRKHRA